GDVAALFGFSGNSNLYGATMAGGGSFTTANAIATPAGGSSTVTNSSVALSATGQATATWDLSDNTGSNPVVQFSTKTLAASSWPQALGRGGANDLSATNATAGTPSLAIAPDGTTTIAYTTGNT